MGQPKSSDHAALGAALRSFRQGSELTLEQLGERVEPDGMNPRYISATERGEINISYGTLLRLCRGLGITLTELVIATETRAGRPAQISALTEWARRNEL